MNRIIKILKTLNRPGIDQVIEFMKENKHEGSRCYDHMMKNRGDLPEDSIAVCAFFHDLGKASKSRRQIEDHEGRSIRILDKYGFTLTDQERNAILTHHKFEGFLTDPLRKYLSQADMDSTGKWKKANDPNYNSSFGKVLKNIGLTIISKL